MDKLYEILISYSDGDVELIKLPQNYIDKRIKKIISQQRHGKLYVIEIETLVGTALVNNAQGVVCYYDQPELAEIVVKNNKLDILPQQNTVLYIEKTINELEF